MLSGEHRRSTHTVPGGGAPTPFAVHVVNKSQESLRYVDVSFLLQADGLVGDLVHLQRLRVAADPHNVGTFTQRGVHSGAVTAAEQIDLGGLALPPGSGLNLTYQLSFSKKLPSTALTLSMQVQPRQGRRGHQLGWPVRDLDRGGGTADPDSAGLDAESVTDGQRLPGIDRRHGSHRPVTACRCRLVQRWWLAGVADVHDRRAAVARRIGMIGTLVWRRGPQRVETDGDETCTGQDPTWLDPADGR